MSGKDAADVPESPGATLASEHFTADVLGLERATCPAGYPASVETSTGGAAPPRFSGGASEACDRRSDPAPRRGTGPRLTIEEHDHPSLAHRRVATFDARVCEACEFFERCPARLNQEGTGCRVRIDLEQSNLYQRRQAEARGELAPRYDIRAGIEELDLRSLLREGAQLPIGPANSELKRAHDLGRPRVRGRPRVLLAVCLKVVACNIKRMVRALMAQDLAPMPAAA